jgi:iron complex outermembrane receptor protein
MGHHHSALAAAVLLIAATAVRAEEASTDDEPATWKLPTIVVESRATDGFRQTTLLPSEQSYAPSDPADLLRYAPGAAVNKNGPLTGISQYRGMFGSRINTQVDGLNVAPACPNWMDPPLSFIPIGDLQELTVVRGISPVSAGSEAIGGTIRATTRQGDFGASEDFEPHGIVGIGGQTVADGYHGDALFWLSNQHHRFQISGVYRRGDDFNAGHGERVFPTRYERWKAGVGYGYENGGQKGGFSYSFDETGSTGTPALPMDVRSVGAHSLRAHFGNTFGPMKVETRLHYVDGEHEMDNFSLRGPPRTIRGTELRRLSKSSAEDYAYDLRGSLALGDGELRIGTDGWRPKYNAKIRSPDDPSFEVVNFKNVRRNRLGLFGEWEGELVGNWSLLAGVRYTHISSDADRVSAAGLGMNQGNAELLAAEFNASSRRQRDHLLDLSAVLTLALTDGMTLEFGAARKQRGPSYQERYLWLPLESTAGLADGRNYIGDVNLKPETAYHFDLGLNAVIRGIEFTPRVFYKRVDDYIQGSPLTSGPAVAFRGMAANAVRGMGFCQANPTDPTCVPMQFSNVDAEFYGVDAGFRASVTDRWRIDGNVSYVRGRRRDVSDNLYRIAPLNGILALTYLGRSWSISAEGEFFANQGDVSEVNAEQETDGYALLNVYGQYTFTHALTIRTGVRNVFGSFYQNHVSGINRVVADRDGGRTDLDLGERLPGPGRNFFIQAEYRF